MDVEFKGLSVTNPGSKWRSKVPDKVILKNLSGQFHPGQLSGIMGPSGAGKSSLLNAISGFRSRGVTGELLSNGRPRDESLFRKCLSYIMQDDQLQPLLTLGELMAFAGKLKLSTTMTAKQRDVVISDIINKMGLSLSRNTFTEKLSGGQKKRLSIALELINNPLVFFLDEPTSGLDDVSARQCLDTLQSLARQNRTLICTIHQPSAALFGMLDRVYVVSQGVCVYQGGADGLLSFLGSVGLRCPLRYNPADYVIEMTDGEESRNIQLLTESILNGKVVWHEPSTGNDASEAEFNENSLEHIGSGIEFATSPWSQFCTILCRMMLQMSRNRTSLWIQLGHHLLCSVLLGALYYDVAQDGDRGFFILKATLMVVIYQAYTCAMVPIITYPKEVKLLKREYFNRWYGFTPYYAALAVSTVPTKIFSVIFMTIFYYLIGLPFEMLRYSLFCLIGLLVSFVAEGVGYSIGSRFNVTNGSCIGPLVLGVFLLLAFYGHDFAKEIPIWLILVMESSFMRCGFVAMTTTVLAFDRAVGTCDSYLGYCRFADPKSLLAFLDFQRLPLWVHLAVLAAMLLGAQAGFYVSLRMRLKKR